ncbi:MAG: lysophospholipid acyltransferase family protein [Pseudomonadota bacterium]
MTPTWHSEDMPDVPPISVFGWVLALIRFVLIVFSFCIGVLATLLLRLAERPIFGLRRPLTSPITQLTFRATLAIIGLRIKTVGEAITGNGAVVSNHISWLDILVLNSPQKVVFVSKAEVSGWPGVGFLARLVGTIFIERDPRQAVTQQKVLTEALESGRRLLFFPEGTSTDGRQVLPFKSTLFGPFFVTDELNVTRIQPITLSYTAPNGVDPRFYGWWGDMELGPHALQVLAQLRHGQALIQYHPPVNVADFPDRKALAKALQTNVENGMDTREVA